MLTTKALRFLSCWSTVATAAVAAATCPTLLRLLPILVPKILAGDLSPVASFKTPRGLEGESLGIKIHARLHTSRTMSLRPYLLCTHLDLQSTQTNGPKYRCSFGIRSTPVGVIWRSRQMPRASPGVSEGVGSVSRSLIPQAQNSQVQWITPLISETSFVW